MKFIVRQCFESRVYGDHWDIDGEFEDQREYCNSLEEAIKSVKGMVEDYDEYKDDDKSSRQFIDYNSSDLPHFKITLLDEDVEKFFKKNNVRLDDYNGKSFFEVHMDNLPFNEENNIDYDKFYFHLITNMTEHFANWKHHNPDRFCNNMKHLKIMFDAMSQNILDNQ